jgi:acyl-coenzyme A thioesterase PaaI-like protein
MTMLATLWEKTNGLPMGKKIFSTLYAQKAPYFATIHATVTELRPNYAEVVIPKRRSVHNHIGTVHAIALCNGAEMAMGALAEMTVPSDKRWIPKGMDINYTGKADSDITVTAETDPEQWTSDNPDLHVRVKAVTANGTECFNGVIKLWVTSKKK